MIVPMTQFSILVYHRDFSDFLRKLQVQGLLDITLSEVYSEKSDTEYYPLLQRLEKLLQQLKAEEKLLRSENRKLQIEQVQDPSLQGISVLEEGESLMSTILELRRNRDDLEARIKKAKVWGDFDREQIDRLCQEKGLKFVVASASEKRYPTDGSWERDFPLEVISKADSQVYFVYVCQAGEDITAESLSAQLGASVQIGSLPEQAYPLLLTEMEVLDAEYAQTRLQIENFLGKVDILRRYKDELLTSLSYKKVSNSVSREAEGKLCMIEGFLPTGNADDFEGFLEQEEVVYQRVEADDLPMEDTPKIPVLLKNNRFARLFEPITLLFSLPNYRELDLTPLMAPFFMAFFGFCFGDAGYGLVLIIAALILARKLKGKQKDYAWLTFWFGVATVVFGGLSGTFFGISLIEVEFLGKLRNLFFDSNKMMVLSLAIGALQIIYGMVVNVFRIRKEYGFKYALGKLGWLCIIVGGAILIGLPSLGLSLPAALNYLLYVIVALGAAFALFYNTPGKNPFYNLGLGLWDTYNTATGLVGDLLSYIRLFALGLTGGILGAVFNTLALDAANGIGVPVVSQLVMLLILLFGHGLNFALCILGSVVHPLRLTFVEFYKNSGFEGGGKAYDPFRRLG